MGAGDTLRLLFCAGSRAVACSDREQSHMPVPKLLLSGELGRRGRGRNIFQKYRIGL